MQPIHTTLTLWLVAVSIFTSIVACYAAFSFAERVARSKGVAYCAWLGSGSVSMGLGIWSMHYLGMLAVRLPVDVVYHVPTVLASLLCAVAASGIVLFLVSRGELRWKERVVGSVLMGSGIGAMHYIGMRAMRGPVMHAYHPAAVAGSLVLAVGFSWMALSIAFSMQRRAGHGEWLRLGAASLMGLGIASMHYTAMAAMTFVRGPVDGSMAASTGNAVHITTLGVVAVAFTTAVVLLGSLITTLLDRRVYEQLQEERDRLHAAAECGLDSLYFCSSVRNDAGEIEDFRFDFLNTNVERNLGRPLNEMLGRTMREAHPLIHDMGHFPLFREVALTGQPLIYEFKYAARPGVEKWVRIQAVKLRDGVAITASDITLRKRDEERILHLAQHDPLTGLVNRSLLGDRIGQALERVKRSGGKAGVFLIDLDNFKRINDSLGHAAGDKVLVTVAGRLKKAVRASDSVIRIGGDEFVVLIEETGQLADLEKCADKILESFLQPVDVEGHGLMVTCSIGLAAYPDSASSVDELLTRADVAMYSAKHRGKNQYEVFLPMTKLAVMREPVPSLPAISSRRDGAIVH